MTARIGDRVAVEQAIARGEEHADIAVANRVTLQYVAEVWEAMEACAWRDNAAERVTAERHHGPRRRFYPHGTAGRAEQHRRDREPLCEPCRRARQSKVA